MDECKINGVQQIKTCWTVSLNEIHLKMDDSLFVAAKMNAFKIIYLSGCHRCYQFLL